MNTEISNNNEEQLEDLPDFYHVTLNPAGKKTIFRCGACWRLLFRGEKVLLFEPTRLPHAGSECESLVDRTPQICHPACGSGAAQRSPDPEGRAPQSGSAGCPDLGGPSFACFDTT